MRLLSVNKDRHSQTEGCSRLAPHLHLETSEGYTPPPALHGAQDLLFQRILDLSSSIAIWTVQRNFCTITKFTFTISAASHKTVVIDSAETSS